MYNIVKKDGGSDMKKLISLLCCLCIIIFCVASSAEESIENIIKIDLKSATDEELKKAIEAIKGEQKARIDTKLTISESEIQLVKGKKADIKETISDIKDGVEIKETIWETMNPEVATVKKGTITAVEGGATTIKCKVLLSDDIELTAECKVNVIVPVNKLKLENDSFTMEIGETATLNPLIEPENATLKDLDFKSKDSNIVSVDNNGNIKAEHGGVTEIIVSTQDGSEKQATAKVTVPSIVAKQTSYKISNKNGEEFRIKYYGTQDNLNVKVNGSNASIDYKLDGTNIVIKAMPIKAGTQSITIFDSSEPKNKVSLKLEVSHDAVYDNVSYPKIDYKDSSRYPDNYKEKPCSFSGRVLQVMSGGSYTDYRISSRGRYDNVVYVTISNSDITTPIIEDDIVTVYGSYSGYFSYESVMGATITIPSVMAEKIELN